MLDILRQALDLTNRVSINPLPLWAQQVVDQDQQQKLDAGDQASGVGAEQPAYQVPGDHQHGDKQGTYGPPAAPAQAAGPAHLATPSVQQQSGDSHTTSAASPRAEGATTVAAASLAKLATVRQVDLTSLAGSSVLGDPQQPCHGQGRHHFPAHGNSSTIVPAPTTVTTQPGLVTASAIVPAGAPRPPASTRRVLQVSTKDNIRVQEQFHYRPAHLAPLTKTRSIMSDSPKPEALPSPAFRLVKKAAVVPAGRFQVQQSRRLNTHKAAQHLPQQRLPAQQLEQQDGTAGAAGSQMQNPPHQEARPQQPPDQSATEGTAPPEGNQQLQDLHCTGLLQSADAGNQQAQEQAQQQPVQPQQPQRLNPLPVSNGSVYWKPLAYKNLAKATSTLIAPANKLAQGPSPTQQQLISREQALTLVSGLCPGIRALLLLDQATTPLQDRLFLEDCNRTPVGWSNGLLGSVSRSQLQCAAGLNLALAGVKVGWWGGYKLKGQLVQLATGAATTHQSLRTLFWQAHALLLDQLGQPNGLVVSSSSRAAQALQEYVIGTAHVGRLLVAIYHLLLPPADKAQAALRVDGQDAVHSAATPAQVATTTAAAGVVVTPPAACIEAVDSDTDAVAAGGTDSAGSWQPAVTPDAAVAADFTGAADKSETTRAGIVAATSILDTREIRMQHGSMAAETCLLVAATAENCAEETMSAQEELHSFLPAAAAGAAAGGSGASSCGGSDGGLDLGAWCVEGGGTDKPVKTPATPAAVGTPAAEAAACQCASDTGCIVQASVATVALSAPQAPGKWPLLLDSQLGQLSAKQPQSRLYIDQHEQQPLPQWHHLPRLLTAMPDDANSAATKALTAALAALDAPVGTLVQRMTQQQQSVSVQQQADQQEPELIQLVSTEASLMLVSGFCPGLSRLLVLDEAATPLWDLKLEDVQKSSTAGENQGGSTEGTWWQGGLQQVVPNSQLQSTAGFKCAISATSFSCLGGVKLKCQLQLAADAASTHKSLRRLFWAALRLLQECVQQGVVVPQSSTDLAAQVLREYVQGLAHVARILVRMHNMLLPLVPPAMAAPAGHVHSQSALPARAGVAPKAAAAAAAPGAGLPPFDPDRRPRCVCPPVAAGALGDGQDGQSSATAALAVTDASASEATSAASCAELGQSSLALMATKPHSTTAAALGGTADDSAADAVDDTGGASKSETAAVCRKARWAAAAAAAAAAARDGGCPAQQGSVANTCLPTAAALKACADGAQPDRLAASDGRLPQQPTTESAAAVRRSSSSIKDCADGGSPDRLSASLPRQPITAVAAAFSGDVKDCADGGLSDRLSASLPQQRTTKPTTEAAAASDNVKDCADGVSTHRLSALPTQQRLTETTAVAAAARNGAGSCRGGGDGSSAEAYHDVLGVAGLKTNLYLPPVLLVAAAAGGKAGVVQAGAMAQASVPVAAVQQQQQQQVVQQQRESAAAVASLPTLHLPQGMQLEQQGAEHQESQLQPIQREQLQQPHSYQLLTAVPAHMHAHALRPADQTAAATPTGFDFSGLFVDVEQDQVEQAPLTQQHGAVGSSRVAAGHRSSHQGHSVGWMALLSQLPVWAILEEDRQAQQPSAAARPDYVIEVAGTQTEPQAGTAGTSACDDSGAGNSDVEVAADSKTGLMQEEQQQQRCYPGDICPSLSGPAAGPTEAPEGGLTEAPAAAVAAQGMGHPWAASSAELSEGFVWDWQPPVKTPAT